MNENIEIAPPTPEESLKLLDSLASTLPMNRADHAKVAMAVAVLEKALNVKVK
jgi:hypothetical protein